MRRKISDIVDSEDPIVQAIIDKAVRLDGGCWVYKDELNDEWGRPWIKISELEAIRVDVAVWEWMHDVKVPTGYDVESLCGVYGCCSPRCLILWEPQDETE